ncbi:MAG: two-component sensor histidine kinase [Cellvibrio sp. 79]|nr:MAG: two-component sensor histidine kinase [Cellvibrio sp. 79]
MTRFYLKIFFTFWLITAAIIVGTNIVVHWFDMTPDGNLQHNNEISDDDPAKRLLFQMVGNAVNRNTRQLVQDLRSMPNWSTRFVYVIDKENRDLLDRPLPPGVMFLAPRLTAKHPFDKVQDRNRKLFGRYITLNDGNSVKLITISSGRDEGQDRDIIWELFLDNIWPLLLVSILVSGSACFFLARHFTRSINTLQRATQQIARGDLSVRIGNQFHGRQDEIAALGRDFDRMTERLEKAMQEQKRLIKDVSHELRTPLARLQIALALARQRSNGVVDQELDRIKQAADYLNDIITDILTLPVQGQDSWVLDDVLDLVSLLQTLMDNYHAEAYEKNINIRFKCSLEEALVATHGNMLVGVFENTLRNALLYTPANAEICVQLSETGDGEYYRVEIMDQGPGVPADALENIFQPFYRTDEARARESGGYGLGLAIAQRSVSLHQGRIWAENRPAGGLNLCTLLPQIKNS